MDWRLLGAQFCLELAFGVLVALAFVPRAPVGTLFYRIMGTAAAIPTAVAVALALSGGTVAWSDPAPIAAIVGLVAWPVHSGPFRGARWAAGLAVALAGTGVALVCLLARSEAISGGGALALASLSALATGTVAGSVGLAMVLGHWYLTVPKLPVAHLRRLNRVTVVAMLASLALVVTSCAVLASGAAESASPLASPFGWFYVATRVAVGLLFPLGFAWMTASALSFGNTRSATGILYASTVLVMIGAAVSVSLQSSYGIPI